MELQDIQKRFNYHAPKHEDTKQSHEEVRNRCKSLAIALNLIVPEGREKSLAFTKLEEVMMWANAGIARHEQVD